VITDSVRHRARWLVAQTWAVLTFYSAMPILAVTLPSPWHWTPLAILLAGAGFEVVSWFHRRRESKRPHPGSDS
jgi:hypothetical protein